MKKSVAEQLEDLQSEALDVCREASESLEIVEDLYERSVLAAWDLDCGASAIGRAVGLSEGAIRGYVRRRAAKLKRIHRGSPLVRRRSS